LHQFDEHHSALEGFSEYYNKVVHPLFLSKENERKEILKTAFVSCGLIIVFGLILSIWSLSQLGGKFLFFLFGFVTLFSAFWTYKFLIRGIRKFAKQEIIGAICQYLGFSFVMKPSPRPSLAGWSGLGLIRRNLHEYSKVIITDRMQGKIRGLRFDSVEVKTHIEDTSVGTIFHGQLISLELPYALSGRTAVLRNISLLQPNRRSGMKRVGFVDSKFEGIFEVYSTDQVEARYLLTPTLMQTILDIEQEAEGWFFRLGFEKNKLFIAIETKDQFEVEPMINPLTDPSHTQKILNEFSALYNLIDAIAEPMRL